jgi:3-hydroxyisobutyrate dehydrogenase-like beta-hydroxyacid dehydrogenase
MIGGRKKVFESVREYFEPMGKTLFYCGSQGMGLHAKLSQNLVLANMMQGFIEGMVLATKAGVKPELMLEVLTASAAKAGLISFKAPDGGAVAVDLRCPRTLRCEHRPRERG